MGAWRWAAGDRKTAWLCAGLAVVSGVFAVEAVRASVFAATRPFPFGDFFALWSYARLVLRHPAGLLYDAAWLHRAQVGMGMGPGEVNPFPYPPTFLLLVWPLGLMPFGVACLAWIGGTLGLLLVAVCAGTRHGAMWVGAMLCAQTTAACVVAGQGGFLVAALLVGGLRLADRRPVLAGVLFGLLTCKPQFGLMVPVALVAAGRWRCIASACATTAVLAALDTAMFGAGIWGTWLRSIPDYVAVFDAATVGSRVIPTVVGNARTIGLAPGMAEGVQAVASLLSAGAVWAAWRRPGPYAVPLLLAATCLATPHAFLYDLPMLTVAALLFASRRLEAAGSLVLPEVGVLASVLTMPVAMLLLGPAVPVSSVTTGAFVWLCLAGGWARAGCRAMPPHPGLDGPGLDASVLVSPVVTVPVLRLPLLRHPSSRP